jgi:4-amino-4-deoxy-L-arabinose transferase-like glycosyltransferase
VAGAGAPAAASGPSRPPWLGIALIAVAAVAVEMAVSGRYGYVRDELYFLSAGHHPAFGYVDQPPLTPVLARISAAATGNTLVGFRILPALALAALVVMTAAMSRLLGAGRTGQLLAALAAATCAEYLGAMHELTTTTPDSVFWAVTLVLVMRLLASRDRRWWVAIGGCVGVGSEAKWNIGFLVAALAAGFLLTDVTEQRVWHLVIEFGIRCRPWRTGSSSSALLSAVAGSPAMNVTLFCCAVSPCRGDRFADHAVLSCRSARQGCLRRH